MKTAIMIAAAPVITQAEGADEDEGDRQRQARAAQAQRHPRRLR